MTANSKLLTTIPKTTIKIKKIIINFKNYKKKKKITYLLKEIDKEKKKE